MVLISSSAQTKNDSLLAIKYLKEAQELTQAKDYKASNIKALEAAKLFEVLQDWNNWLNSYYEIFDNSDSLRDFTFFIQNIEKALLHVPKKEITYLPYIYNYLGFAYSEEGNIYKALEVYKIAVKFHQRYKNNREEGILYGSIAILYMQVGDYSKAITYLKNALKIDEGFKESFNKELYSNKLYSLSQAYYYKGDLENAVEKIIKAQEIYDPKDGAFEHLKAQIEFKKGDTKKALKTIQKAIELASKKELIGHVVQSEILQAEIYLAIQQPQKALTLLKKALIIYKNYPNRRKLGKLYVLIGDAQQKMKQYDQSLETYQNALQTFLPNFNENNPTINPSKDVLINEIWIMEIIRNKGTCFLEKYKQAQKDKWLYLAAENYELALHFVENVKLGFDETESKLRLTENTHHFYKDVIKTNLLLFDKTNEESYKKKAFYTAQRATAFTLQNLLSEQKVLKNLGVHKDTITLLNTYQKKIVQLHKKINVKDSTHVDNLENKLFIAKENLYNLKNTLSKKYPYYAKLKDQIIPVKVKAIQQHIGKETIVIKYFITDETLYVFSITNSNFNIDTIESSNFFYEQVTNFRKSISNTQFITADPKLAEEQYLKTAYSLYQILLKKTLNHYNSTSFSNITIIPDDVLHTIPFQALLTQKKSSWENSKNLLIEKYAIGYHFFCKAILETDQKTNNITRFKSFGLEYDDYTLKDLFENKIDSVTTDIVALRAGLTKLPFSDDEAKKISEIMKGESFLNEHATKSNFLTQAPQTDILHISAHAILDKENPNRSSLVFIKNDKTTDNILQLDEIQTLKLQAKMIVLSACNTGFGKNRKGEGLQSLTRAFRLSGISSITASLWSVSDESSSKIMIAYYKFLKRGFKNDIALQKAQLEYLTNDNLSSPRFRSPFYWAAWMPIGNTIKVQEETSILIYIFITLGIFSLISIIIFRRLISFLGKK